MHATFHLLGITDVWQLIAAMFGLLLAQLISSILAADYCSQKARVPQ